jgi:hypothetical protein
MKPDRAPRLGQEHRTELARADKGHGHGAALGLAFGQQRCEIHGVSSGFREDAPGRGTCQAGRHFVSASSARIGVKPMRAEIAAVAAEIKQSLDLLRRFL